MAKAVDVRSLRIVMAIQKNFMTKIRSANKESFTVEEINEFLIDSSALVLDANTIEVKKEKTPQELIKEGFVDDGLDLLLERRKKTI